MVASQQVGVAKTGMPLKKVAQPCSRKMYFVRKFKIIFSFTLQRWAAWLHRVKCPVRLMSNGKFVVSCVMVKFQLECQNMWWPEYNVKIYNVNISDSPDKGEGKSDCFDLWLFVRPLPISSWVGEGGGGGVSKRKIWYEHHKVDS